MASNDDSDITIPKTLYISRERKLTLLTLEGFSNKFLDAIDKLDIECVFCFLVIRNATQISACGHSFCATCWTDWVSSHNDTSSIRCPIDNEFVDLTQVFIDRKQDRLIGSLIVYCDNVDFGCTVTPELRYIQAHLEKCEFGTVECGRKCGQVIMLRCFNDHMDNHCPRRSVECLKCGRCMDAIYFPSHEYMCQMTPLICQYCFTKDIPRSQLADHHKVDCRKFPTLCSFAVIGCSEKVVREALAAHHEAKSHDHLRLLNASQLYQTTGITDRSGGGNTYELPSPLWNTVCEDGTNVQWSELPGCEGSSGENGEVVGAEGIAVSLWEKVKKLENEKEAMLKEMEVMKRASKDAKDQIQKLTIYMKKGAHPQNVIEERKICPCSWTVKLVKDIKDITSPIFYTVDGYAMVFRAHWRKKDDTMKFIVGVLLHKGDDDERVEWPYKGDEVLTVRDAATGEKVGEGKVFPITNPGAKRPTKADGTNGTYLTEFWLDAGMKNKVMKLTMQKK